MPPGYRIECSLDPSDPNPIKVTTPTGTTTRPNLAYGQGWSLENRPEVLENFLPGQNVAGSPSALLAIPEQLAQKSQDQQQAGGQIEFNHAISYVNKIKTRFANQPDVYKQFLEILQTYQREQKPISEVYEQVTVLFANSPDLLDDFKQFLPDTGNQGYLQHHQRQLHEGGFYASNGASQLPPVGNFQPPLGTSGYARGNLQGQYQQQASYMPLGYEGDQEQFANNDSTAIKKKKEFLNEPYLFENSYNNEAQYSNLRSGVQATKLKPAGSRDGVSTNPTLVPGIPEPVPPYEPAKSSSLQEEIGFFDKVKKAIGNKQTYTEFLKILNLYSQDIIDKETLVERVDSFLGDNNKHLLTWFKQFIGYEPKTQHIESITFKKHQLELSLCKAYGPSYRQLPKAETYAPCSGRDEMCWEVLNDEWVGHPTWASEDSGFIAHRKNQYEEILFKIEEERHEFDYIMESNLRTIQTLETIANRIANMTPEQKANFKLPPGLGGTSTSIYKKVIRKVYDKDRGFEVIDALHENPAIAVPIVLKRLKQKDEEWKRSQREWNKVWREMEQKVFYKSLDHLGLTFKQADKKLLTTKQLVSEISTVKVEQQNKRMHPLTPKPQEQLNYQFKDFEILFDIVRLSFVFINHSSSYSAHDREKLSQFFKFFISRFFSILTERIDEALEERDKNIKKGASNSSQQVDQSTNNEGESSLKKRHHEQDLLRDVLKKQSKSKKQDSNDSPSQASSEQEEQDMIQLVDKSSELWIDAIYSNPNVSDRNTERVERDTYNLFCNSTIYVFFRHLRTLYERLEEVKGMNDEISKEIRSRKVPQFAIDLNLVSHKLEEMEIQISGNEDSYQQVLRLSERLIEGDIEHQWFEESLRQGYRNKAYKLYTIDKVVQAMIKHMYSIVSDSKTSEMMVLFESDRSKTLSSAKDQILYRMQVRSLMGPEENMFKIAFKESDSSVNIQFVSLDDLTINDYQKSEEKYNYYVTSYVMYHPTEGVPASKINMPFAKCFIENVDEENIDGYVNSGLKVSICENSYRLFFEADTEDEFTSKSLYEKPAIDQKLKEDRISTLTRVLDDPDFGWKLTLDDGESATSLDEKFKILLDKGAESYKSAINKEADDIEMPEAEKTNSDEYNNNNPSNTAINDNQESTDEFKKSVVKSEAVDVDSTVHENNDTTIQQEGNDTTTEDASMNHEDSYALQEGNEQSV